MINDLWYKNAVIYCLSVATYMDANGDGIGDFEGLIRQLDYLQGMGVTAIWLMPFQPSSFKDDGYDVADYYGVDPRYGTLGDFVTTAAASAVCGCLSTLLSTTLRTITLGSSRPAAIRKSKHRDWYVWSKKKPKKRQLRHCLSGCTEVNVDYDQAAGRVLLPPVLRFST